MVGPSLAGIGTRSAQRITDPAYKGTATDAAGYIRESIENPSAYLVEGQMFSSADRSFMPDNFKTVLSAAQIDQLVAYLSTLR